MRYSATINNVKAVDWGLNVQQAYLFVFFYELPSWAESIVKGGKTYFFASKNKAIKEMPLLTDKRDTMYRYYKQIEKKGLIEIIKVDGKDYVRLLPKAKEWNCKSDTSDKNPNDLGNKSEPTSDKNPTYNTYNKNNSYNDDNSHHQNQKNRIPDLNSDDPNETIEMSKEAILRKKFMDKVGNEFASPDEVYDYMNYCVYEMTDFWNHLKRQWGISKASRRKIVNATKEFSTWAYSKRVKAKPPKTMLPMLKSFMKEIDVREYKLVN